MQFARHRLSADTDLSQVSFASSRTEDKLAGKQDFPSPKSNWQIETQRGMRVCTRTCARGGLATSNTLQTKAIRVVYKLDFNQSQLTSNTPKSNSLLHGRCQQSASEPGVHEKAAARTSSSNRPARSGQELSPSLLFPRMLDSVIQHAEDFLSTYLVGELITY